MFLLPLCHNYTLPCPQSYQELTEGLRAASLLHKAVT